MITLNEATVTLVIFALGVAFWSGAYVMSMRGARKQINGLGVRLNRSHEDAMQEIRRVTLALIHICPDAKREEVVRILLDDHGKESTWLKTL